MHYRFLSLSLELYTNIWYNRQTAVIYMRENTRYVTVRSGKRGKTGAPAASAFVYLQEGTSKPSFYACVFVLSPVIHMGATDNRGRLYLRRFRQALRCEIGSRRILPPLHGRARLGRLFARAVRVRRRRRAGEHRVARARTRYTELLLRSVHDFSRQRPVGGQILVQEAEREQAVQTRLRRHLVRGAGDAPRRKATRAYRTGQIKPVEFFIY